MSSVLYSPALDVVASLQGIILSPLLSGPALLAATAAPDAVRDAARGLAARLPAWLPGAACLDLPHIQTALRVLFAVSLVRALNRTLSSMAHNSWRLGKAPGWNWPDEIAVVTGGSGGIGQGIVERLVARGVRVAVFDVQPLAKSMQNNPKIRYYQCDVTKSESIAAAADGVRRDFGHPTILVNNAGVTKIHSVLKIPESFLRTIFNVNVMAHWLLVQQFLPRMVQLNKGHIVTVASIASYVALPTAVDYSATKAGAQAFHEGLAQELKHFYKAPNVMTSLVQPNFARTALIEDFADRLERSGVRMLTPSEIADKTVAQILSKRGGQLIIPHSADVIAGIRGWPTWLQEVLRDILGRASVAELDKQ